MNNVYNNGREIYTIRGDMCYDNKVMANTTLPEHMLPQAPPAVCLTITETDKNKKHSPLKFKKRLRKRLIIDVFIAVIVLGLILLIELDIIPQTKLGYICQDPALSYPFRGDTISVTTLLVGCFFGPILFIILIEIIRENSFKRICVGDVWHYYRECLIGTSLVLIITEVIKVLVGEHRPHFFDSCLPDVNCKTGSFILEYNCTNPNLSNYFKNDISRSFPSGHTSISLFIALYCSYLVQIRIPDFAVSKLTKPFLITVCLTWTLLCSLSRITDRRHHWWDVLGGAFLGLCGAWYILKFLNNTNNKDKNCKLVRTDTSSTTLIDVKNKGATSVVI